MELCITTCRIHGLNKNPYYSIERSRFFWDLTLSDISTNIRLENLVHIMVGKNPKEAYQYCNYLKMRFREFHINEGDEVFIMFTEDGSLRAIKSNEKDLWIDADDKFTKKNFAYLKVFGM